MNAKVRSIIALPSADTQDERFVIRQPVRLPTGGALEQIFGMRELTVNSLHRQGIERVADGLTVEAEAPDGTIEAVCVRDAPAFAMGVQWHPEYWATSDDASARIFRAFGDAVRGRALAHTLQGAAANK